MKVARPYWSCVNTLTLVLPSDGEHAVEMLHRLSSQPRDAVLYIRGHGPRSAVGIDKYGDEGLRHPRTRPAPIDAQRFDALPPDGVRKRGREVDYVHEGAKLAPILRCMGPHPFWRLQLVLGGVEPIQHGCFNDCACSGAAELRDDITRLGRARLPGNPRKRSLNGGVIYFYPRLRQYPDRK
jgi:hypothetical protein